MRFAALSYVHLLWLLPALLALYVYGFARKRRALSAFIRRRGGAAAHYRSSP